MTGVKKQILDDLSALMNKYINEVEGEDAKQEMVNSCLEVLLMFAFISAHVAGIDEETMHELVGDTYEDLIASEKNNANN